MALIVDQILLRNEQLHAELECLARKNEGLGTRVTALERERAALRTALELLLEGRTARDDVPSPLTTLPSWETFAEATG